MTGPALRLLQCPACAAPLQDDRHGGVACTASHRSIGMQAGVLDFVAGAAATTLDTINYDALYGINAGVADQALADIRATAGASWPATLGTALEIGCGTGGFSMGVLRAMPFDHAVLTDISPKMLSICRRNLQAVPGLPTNDITYATYGGTEGCFAHQAYDTCFGTAVLHHVIDVPRLLRHIADALKPGGVAFFLEPARPFHQALLSTLAGIVAAWRRHGIADPQDTAQILNWIRVINYNLVNTGDMTALAGCEDKHMFDAPGFEAMAREAGFAGVQSLPHGTDAQGLDTALVYLTQIGVGETTLQRLRQDWSAAQWPHFSQLRLCDRAPSYLFWLEKSQPRNSRKRGTDAPAAPSGLAAVALLPLRLWLQITGTGNAVDVDGWCVAPVAVSAILMIFDGDRQRLFVDTIRQDVHEAINADYVYPPLNSLFSGIKGQVRLADGHGRLRSIHVLTTGAIVIARTEIRQDWTGGIVDVSLAVTAPA